MSQPSFTLDFDDLHLQASAQSAGLSNFGDASYVAPMRALLHSLLTEADLNEQGLAMWHTRIVTILSNRLRLWEWLRKHPEIHNEKIERPVVIVGLPRTGTTMLHRILASDSRFHAPLWYEVRNPAPYLDWQPNGTDQRIVESTAEVDAMLTANPELAAIHPMDPVGADEEILILENSFYSTVPEAYCWLPTYAAWLEENDNAPGYVFLELCLKFLQWQKKQRGESAERWLLKTPHHLHHMAILLKQFPDATVVQTHRDPIDTIPSIASFHYNLYVLCSNTVSKAQLAAHWATKFCNGMTHTIAVRQQNESPVLPQFFDAWFQDTVGKPFEVIESLYSTLGMALTAEAKSAMEQYRELNKREERPSHEYTLEEYGLSEAGLKAQFAEYRSRYIENR